MVAHQERLASKNVEQCGSCVITCLEQGAYGLQYFAYGPADATATTLSLASLKCTSV